MTRRTVILLAVLLAVGALAVWRRRPASTTAVRQQEVQAEAAARKFMALREAEERADREVWSPTLPAVRIEQEVVLGVERAMRERKIDSGVLPQLSERLAAPAGYSLRWLQARTLGVRPLSKISGGPTRSLSNLEMEVVLEGSPSGNAPRAIWTARFLAEADWSNGEPPQLQGYRFVEPPTILSGMPVFEPWADLLIPTNGVGLFTDPLLFESTVQGPRLHLAGAGVGSRR
jgi:hypothetical protein